MPDPRARDPRFPDRPTHPDFIRLSEAVQNHDAMTEQLNVNPFAVMGVDEESFMYFLKNRMGVVSQRMHRDFTNPRFAALYLDAFALGKRYAEMLTEEPPECPRHSGTWGDDMTCPRCTKYVRELLGGETIVAAPSGDGTYLIVRDINDPGPMPGDEE